MEFNALCNLNNIIDHLSEKIGENKDLQKDINKLKKQVELLERYMVAVNTQQDQLLAQEYCRGMFYDLPEAYRSKFPYEAKIPAWHEVLENPKAFPTLQEKLKKGG